MCPGAVEFSGEDSEDRQDIGGKGFRRRLLLRCVENGDGDDLDLPSVLLAVEPQAFSLSRQIVLLIVAADAGVAQRQVAVCLDGVTAMVAGRAGGLDNPCFSLAFPAAEGLRMNAQKAAVTGYGEEHYLGTTLRRRAADWRCYLFVALLVPKFDISKQATPRSVHYAPLGSAIFETDIALLREMTPAGRAFVARAPEFCRMERAILHRLQAGKKISKPALCREFGFPGRMVNAAHDAAGGLVRSARECANLAFAGTTEALTRALAHYMDACADPARRGELHGRERNIARLIEQEARHELLVDYPQVFVGRAEFARQHKNANWKREYIACRSDHISANGGADETAGNSTLQVSLGPTEDIGGRIWQWFRLAHAGEHLGRFRLWVSECDSLTRAVMANHVRKQSAMVESWFDAAGKKISDRRRAAMIEDGEQPASVRKVKRTVTVKRIGLTIDLRRQENGRWHVHVARQVKATNKALSPEGWIGVDLNCDSVAWAQVAMKDGQPAVSAYGKDHFPAGGPTGTRLTVLHLHINAIVERAAEERCGVCLEYLDFEHCKRWLKTKLGAMLRVMPYRKIRAAFERRCLEAGVPLRYVPPKYSSVLGAIISQGWSHLGRDQAAGVVLALRAGEDGNQWLERTCEEVARAERVSLRFNAKGKYGHNLELVASPPVRSAECSGRQMDSPRYPVEPALQWQTVAGRKIQGGFSTLADFRSARMRGQRRAAKTQRHSHRPPCLKMPGSIVLPAEFAQEPLPCSTLSKVV